MISKEEFIKECDKIIDPKEAEQYNKKRKIRIVLISILLPLEFIVGLLVQIKFGPLNYRILRARFSIVTVIMAVTVAIIFVATEFQWKGVKDKYLQQVIDILLKDYQFTYTSRGWIPDNMDEKLKMSGVVGRKIYSRFSGDFLQVTIPQTCGRRSKNITLMIADVFCDGPYLNLIDGYSGILGYVKFPFKFKCNISLNTNHPVWGKINLEDIKFNKKFEVFTDNEIEAHVILNPTIMETLKEMSKRLTNLKIVLGQDGVMCIGSKDGLFRGWHKKKPSGAAFVSFYDDIADILSIISFINELKDNNKFYTTR